MIKRLWIILPVMILIVSFAAVFSAAGCRPAVPAEEAPAIEVPVTEEPLVEEEPAVVEEPEEKALSEEGLKDELFSKLNNFFDAVTEDKEYAFFSSQTIDIVGNEQEYKQGTKTDIYFIIQGAHSSWKNLEAKEIVVDNDWTTLTITGDRMAEGMEYTGEEISFNFVNEDNEWKIDFSGK